MIEWILAQSGIEDWIQIIIFILIVGGSVFGGIGKALIKKFSPSEPKKRAEQKRKVTIDRPVARPMPPRQTRPDAQHPPVIKPPPPRPFAKPITTGEMPVELPEIFAEMFPEVVAPRRPEHRIHQPQQPAPTPERPGSSRPTPAGRTRKSVRQKVPWATQAVQPVEKEPQKTTPEQRLGKLTSTFEQEEDRLGHVETHIDPHPGSMDVPEDQAKETTAAPRDDWLFGVIRPNRQELRRAIVMNEILSPPLALRDID